MVKGFKAEAGANPVTRMQILISDMERHLAAAASARRASVR